MNFARVTRKSQVALFAAKGLPEHREVDATGDGLTCTLA